MTPALAMITSKDLPTASRLSAQRATVERSQVELHQVKSTSQCGLGADLLRSVLRLGQIARGSDDFRPCAANARAVSTPRPAKHR